MSKQEYSCIFKVHVCMFSSVLLFLTISNGIEICCCIAAICSWYSEVDPAIRRHWEPHVLRVSVNSKLIPRV